MVHGCNFHLTYCTNIHSANGWPKVLASLQVHAPVLRAALAPDQPFGLGLRLSGKESEELLDDDALPRFADFLAANGLYVALINGFPHGAFHNAPVKADVHAPDWREPERVAYTVRLARILAQLLPEGMDGGISTNPLTYRDWVDEGDETMWALCTANLVEVVVELVRIREATGKLIHIDIEPEPDGLLENSREVVRFFSEHLFTGGAADLGRALGVDAGRAREHILEHLRVCLDTCHVAVVYEDPAEALDRLARHGIRIGRVQLSSALRIDFPPGADARRSLHAALEPFAESVYLHQVVERRADGSMARYADLVDALPQIADPAIAEWRVHFHVPIFVERYASFGSTQSHITEILALARERQFTSHLEIETYTWDVLPADLKQELSSSIIREFEWVQQRL